MTTTTQTETRHTIRVQMRGERGQWFTSARQDGVRAETDALALAREVAGDTSDKPTGISVTVHAYQIRSNGLRTGEERLVRRIYTTAHPVEMMRRSKRLDT